ncbi:hypothetical protein A7C91_03885 [Thermococcus piezophilus]|uniref:Uncharacterized protein n=1 Tax=Thermococcus piezophilus TaxID=1712654 RepID=A0A172WGB1_9EURY|nr:hypothetical protein A7C91_03885 [Thermococcus piezophilus]
MKIGSKFQDFALYFVLFALFVYGIEKVYTLKGKFLIVLVLVVGSIYEYSQLKNTDILSEYFSRYYKLRHLILKR